MLRLTNTGVPGTPSRTLTALLLLAACFSSTRQAGGQIQVDINTNELRSIGGVSQLDRERFFTHTETVLPPNGTNLGNLNTLIGSPNGPNVVTGRISTEFDQFIAQSLPQDPSRPGFIEPNALRSRLQGSYRTFVQTSSRYTSIRNNPNAFVINNGRFGAFFPSYFIEPGTGGVPRADAYAEFLSIYLDEVVLGNNAFYPVSPDRFAIELLNEPDLHFSTGFTREDLATWHRDVISAVKADHPTAIIGGPSLAVTSFEANEFGGADNFSRFDERLGRTIDDRANSGIDYYSFHPYERYDVTNGNTLVRQIDQSPGRVNGTLDLVRSRDLASNPGQAPLPISLTEYGSFNLLLGDPALAGYTRAEMQWDLARDIREQLLVYLNRPDVVLNATPFVQGKHFSNDLPTPIGADNVFYEQNAQGQYSETIIAQTFRSYANVSGDYIGIDHSSEDIQVAAFRDGSQVYVLINNLVDSQQTVDLNVLTSLGGIQSATRDRVFQQGDINSPQGGQNVFIDNENALGTLQNFSLNPDEGTVLTLTLTDDTAFGLETLEQTYFSTDTVLPITSPTGLTSNFTINAPLDDSALSAKLRLTYNRPSGDPETEGLRFQINGTLINIPAGSAGIDDGDLGLQTREIEVPLSALVDGDNQLIVDFEGGGGFLAATALTITTDLNFSPLLAGDYNDDGIVSAADFVAYRDLLGAPEGSLPNDVDGGVIGPAQLQTFLAQFGQTASQPATSGGQSVPEPTAALLLTLGVATARLRTRR